MKTSGGTINEHILEIMLELCEEENKDLKNENDTLYNYIAHLEKQNQHLVKEYNNLVKLERRLN